MARYTKKRRLSMRTQVYDSQTNQWVYLTYLSGSEQAECRSLPSDSSYSHDTGGSSFGGGSSYDDGGSSCGGGD